MVLLCAITPYNNYFLQNSKIAGNHLPVESIFALLFLVLFINVPLRKLKEQLTLSPAELTTIWIMLIVAVGIPSMGFLQFLFPTLIAPLYFATPENDWAEVLHPPIPPWLIIGGEGAARDFYEGIGRGESVPWVLWLKPLLVWTLFVSVFIGWLIKYAVLKFSGPGTYRKLRFVFLGLIFGEYLMVGVWMGVGLFTKVGYFALPS